MSQSNRIVVLGAGAGGLRVAVGLDRLLLGHREYPVLLVDQRDYHLIQPRLPDVAAGLAPVESAALPLRRLLSGRKVEFVRASVERLDLASRVVHTSAGPLEYRWLVIALGSQPLISGIPGIAANALVLKSAEDARRIDRAVGEALRQAAWKLDQAQRSQLATVVVAGGGYTGVELAAALAERVRLLSPQYRLPEGSGRVLLVERAERVLPEYDREVADAVQRVLRRKCVELRLGVAVTGASGGEVSLSTGENVRCGVLVWAGGIDVPAVVRASGVRLAPNGRLVVDRQMRVQGCQGVYALGDLSFVLGEVAELNPPSARSAARQADVVAHNVFAEITGAAPREHSSDRQDIVVSLGQDDAVAMLHGVVVTGWRAALLRRLECLRYLEAIAGPGGLLAGLRGGRVSHGWVG